MPDPKSTSERLEALKARWESDKGSRVFLQLADEYRRLGRLGDAVNVLEEGLETNEGHLGARVARARCLLELGRSAEAASELERVTEADPTQMVAYRLLVDAYLAEGDADKARQRLRVYGLLNDSDPDIEELEDRIARLERGGAPPPPAEAQAEEAPADESAEPATGTPASPEATDDVELSEDVPLPDDLPALEEDEAGEEPFTETLAEENDQEPFAALPSGGDPEQATDADRPEQHPGPGDEPFGDVLAEPAEPATGDPTAPLSLEDEGPGDEAEEEPRPVPPAETVALDTTRSRPAPPETDEVPAEPPRAAPDPFPGLTLPEDRRPATEPLEDDLFAEPAEPSAEAAAEPLELPRPEPSVPPEEPDSAVSPERGEPEEAEEAGLEAGAPEEPAGEDDPFDLGPPPQESAAGGLDDLFGEPAPPAAPAPEPDTGPEPEPTPPPTPEASVPPPPPEPPAASDVPPAEPEVPPAPPTSPEAPAQGATEEGRATVTLGRLYLRQGHHREADEIFREVLEREPDNEEARRGLDEVAAREAPELTAHELLEAFDPTVHGEGLTARKRYALERYRERIRGSGRDVH